MTDRLDEFIRAKLTGEPTREPRRPRTQDDALRGFVADQLHGDRATLDRGAETRAYVAEQLRPRSREDALRAFVGDGLRAYGWRSARDLRAESAAPEEPDEEPAGDDEADHLEDDTEPLSPEEQAAWNGLDEQTRQAALDGDSSAFDAWRRAVGEAAL